MEAKKILVVEDEKPIREVIAFGLRRSGFQVFEAGDAGSARLGIAEHRPDLILIDWMLPDSSGPEFTHELKRADKTQNIPVIMLTARASEQDKIAGLNSGADDYITKPFSPRELLSRINAVLRRSPEGVGSELIAVSGLLIDAASATTTFACAPSSPSKARPPAARTSTRVSEASWTDRK